MRRFLATATLAGLLATGALAASVWAPGIIIDGNMSDWDGQVPALVTDGTGDGGTGRDVTAVYLANDQNNLYVRIQSANADAFDGNEFSGIDGDNNAATGFNLFGSGIGSDTLVAGASVYGENNTGGGFNIGAATPGSVSWGETVAQMDVEYAIQLSTALPAACDIAGDVSFPGGLGSIINFMYGDGNGGATDTTAVTPYTLASSSGLTPAPIIDEMVLYDTTGHATSRTRDISGGGFTATADTAIGPGGGADVALQVTHFSPGGAAFSGSFVSHRFASPRNITGNTDVTIDVFGDPSLASENLWVGLIDTGGTYFAVSPPAPTTAAWTTANLASTDAWFLQAAGDDGVLDTANIIEWRIGLQDTTATGGSYVVRYDNLRAVGVVPVEMSIFSAD